MIVVERINAAGVAAAAGLENLPHLVERVVEAVRLEHGQHDAELLGRERILLADVGFFDEEERLVRREGEAGFGGDGRGRARDGVRGAPALLVPVGPLQLLLLLRR